MAKKLKLVEVEWIDPASWSRWNSREYYENAEYSECRSVGYLMTKNRDKVVLVQSLDDDGHGAADGIVLPRKVVTNIRELK